MFELDIIRSFSAAHNLDGYPGDCSALHGHNWTVQAFVRVSELDELDIAVDFRVLRTELDAIIADLDHKNLNDLPLFNGGNPTSESIARHIYRRLSAKINDGNAKVAKIVVQESPGSSAAYFED